MKIGALNQNLRREDTDNIILLRDIADAINSEAMVTDKIHLPKSQYNHDDIG